MPRAVTPVETQRFDLKTVPGGFVELRGLTYGEDLRVRGMSMRMHMQQEALGRQRQEAIAKGEDFPSDIGVTIDVDSVTAFMFSKCVVNHNLEDETGKLINFKNRADFTRLDKNVGEEIEQYVQEMNPAEELEPAEGEKVDVKSPNAPLASVSGGQSTKLT